MPEPFPLLLRRALCCAAFIGVCLPRWARAANPSEQVSVSYAAPAECPSAAEFLADVQHAAPRARLADARPDARQFHIVIASSGLTGRLTIDGGNAGVRDAHGANCAEVSRLLAFATALAIDPDITAHQPNDAVPDVAAPASNAEPAPPPRAAPATQRAPVATQWSVAGFAALEGASAPNTSFGGGTFGEAQLLSTAWRPSLRLAAGYLTSPSISVDGAHVSFHSGIAALDACPQTFGSERWSFRPCARFEAERVTARATDLQHSTPQSQTWLVLGIVGHTRAVLAGPLFAELGAGLLFPALRHGVYITDSPQNVSVFHVPVVAGLGEFALGVTFR